MGCDVFISFSFKDQDIASYVVDELQSKYGLSCWICIKNRNGNRYKEEIPEEIKASKAVVVLISKYSVLSKDVGKEIGIASDNSKEIIPFKLENIPYKGTLVYDLQNLVYVELDNKSLKEGIQELAELIIKVVGKKNLNNEIINNQRRIELNDYLEELTSVEENDLRFHEKKAILCNNIALEYSNQNNEKMAKDYLYQMKKIL